MSLSPKIKRALMVLLALYAAVVLTLCVKSFTRKPSGDPKAIARDLRAVAKDHNVELLERDALDIYSRYFAKKGQILSINATALMQMLNFVILLLLLYGLLWRPMIAFLDKRRGDIRTEIESARQGNLDAQERLAEYEKKLQGARGERQALLEDGQRGAQQERQAIVEQARQQAERILEAGRQEMEAEVARARSLLRGEIGGMSVQVAQRILEREVRPEDHDAMIEKFVHQIDSTDLKA